MAETTTTRFSLRRWSAGTDTPQRTEFDTNFANIETLGAIDKQGTFASRPAAGVQGTYYWDTTNEYLWRDTGAAWTVVGSKTQDSVVRSSAVGTVPFTVNAITAQTASLLTLQVNAVTKAFFDKDGNLTAGTYAGVSSSVVNTVTGTVVVAGKGASGQTANLLELKNNANSNMFTVSPTGQVGSPFGKFDASSVVNTGTASNVTNHSAWSGTPAFEVRTAGAAAFNDFMYLKHAAAAASAATRRLGILMKAGDEDASGATRSAAMYIQSTAASFDSPSLRFDVRDVNVWDIQPSSASGSVTPYPVHSNGGYLKATPSGTGALAASNTWIGTQSSGNSMYFRSGTTSNGYYFYAGGVHDSDLGDPGTGGVTLLSILPSTSMGVVSTGKLWLSDVVDAAPDTASPTFMIGSASGINMIFDSDEIQARNNGSPSVMQIQHEDGCELSLGTSGALVSINDVPFYVSVNGSGPSSPQSGWLWLDGRVGQGIKRHNGSVWQLI